MPKRKTRFIPIAKVRMGQEFRHYGNRYRRATEQEAGKHPARELVESLNRPAILAYGIERRQKTPLSFLTHDSDGEIRVVVAADGGPV